MCVLVLDGVDLIWLLPTSEIRKIFTEKNADVLNMSGSPAGVNVH